MNPTLTALIVFACLIAAVLLGRTLRGLLPEGHLSTESKDAVKLAMGLVATMSALVLGLLVSSAKGAYDTERSEVIQMASKVAFLDRVLAAYGPEAAGVRAQFRDNVEEGHSANLARRNAPTGTADSQYASRAIWFTVPFSALSPHNDMQVGPQTQAATLAVDLAQIRSLLAAQSVPSISKPMLIILVLWLVIIFLGFSVLAPPNATTLLALTVSALAVSAAILLILELDEPFGGLIGISSEPMLNALHQIEK